MSSSTSSLPAWPPLLPKKAKNFLAQQATDYALAHGIVYRPLPAAANQEPAGDSVIHAPFSLFPSPFPRPLLHKAHTVQPVYDRLYAQVSVNHVFLDKVIGQSVVHVDEFQKALWEIYTQVKDDLVQPLSLGLFRSDYLMHQIGASELEIKQVEFNTISASFGALCTKVNAMHQHLASTTAGYLGAYPGLEDMSNLPANNGLTILAGGLAAAHNAYLVQQQQQEEQRQAAKTAVLFVVQAGERNAFDQRHIEYELQKQGILVVRQTFAEVQRNVSHASDTASTNARSRTLVLDHAAFGQLEISVVYFRAGYGPGDYPTNVEWETRKMLEQSLAIKCPSIAVQLAGAKKVQQVLSEPGVLQSFLQNTDADQLETLRETFTDLYPLDDSPLGKEGYRLAMESPEKYVLKPQREGGGNNVYRHDIPPFLRQLETSSSSSLPTSDIAKRQAYILMSLIQPPSGVGNYLVKACTRNPDATAAGQDPESRAVLASDTVSELGVYGAILFRADTPQDNASSGIRVLHHESGGYLLRTKGRDSDEGGVAVGFSVIDSLFLI